MVIISSSTRCKGKRRIVAEDGKVFERDRWIWVVFGGMESERNASVILATTFVGKLVIISGWWGCLGQAILVNRVQGITGVDSEVQKYRETSML